MSGNGRARWTALIAVMVVAGCHGPSPSNTSDGQSSAAISPSASSPSPSNPAAGAALTAYRGMWNAFVEAGKTSDADLPALRTYASDEALKRIVSALLTNKNQQKVILGDLKIDPKVTALVPEGVPVEATIVDCVNDENWLVYKASGGLVNDVPGGRHRTTVTVKQSAGTWKVAAFTLEKAGTC